MTGLTAGELASMAETVEDLFTDTSTLHAYISSNQTALGELQHTFSDVLSVACSVSYPGRYQYQNERGQVITLDCDALYKCSKLVDLEPRDEITVRGKRYKVDGIVEGRSVQVVTLKAIETAGEATVVS